MGIGIWISAIALTAVLGYCFSRRAERSGDTEFERRMARSRVNVNRIPMWVRLGGLGYLVVYAISRYLDRSDILNFAVPLFMAVGCLHLFVLRPRLKRQFREKLRACGNRICPQCLYSLEDGRPDGVCPECCTAYTDEGLHAAWAFLHEAEVRKRASSD